jgi:hypothetical protein
MLMKLKKAHLRQIARRVLEERGSRVEVVNSAGVVPGARLRTFDDSLEREVAVRTSFDREIGLTRHPDGRWVTIPKMDEVIVVVPAANDATMAQVLSFDPKTLLSVFNTALAAAQKKNADLSPKAPIFIALDEAHRGRHTEANSGLASKAQWQELVPLSAVQQHSAQVSQAGDDFIERVRREAAQRFNVEPKQVTVEFRILSRGSLHDEQE